MLENNNKRYSQKKYFCVQKHDCFYLFLNSKFSKIGRVTKKGVVAKRGGWEIFERENYQKNLIYKKCKECKYFPNF